MQDALLEALDLPPELLVEGIENEDKRIIIACTTLPRSLCCPHCDSENTAGYDTRRNEKLHTVLNGKKVCLDIIKRRYECKDCSKIFTEVIPGMKGQRTTDFFDQLAQEKSRNQDFSSVARELAVDPSTIALKQDKLSLDRFEVPGVDELRIGLDGKYLNSEDEVFIIGEVKQKKFIGVTKTNNIQELERVLRENIIEKGKSVTVVTIDMDRRLKGVVQRVFGDPVIVADRFHVIKYVNKTIDLCRIAVEKTNDKKFEIKRMLLMKEETYTKIQNKAKWQRRIKRFEQILEDYPDIKVLWDLKNRVHAMYDAKTKKAAATHFDGIIEYLNANVKIHPELSDLTKTLLNWKTAILNFFEYHITNAYIEGINNRIETLKRKKHGFRNKERFLKSVIFAVLPITLFISATIFTH